MPVPKNNGNGRPILNTWQWISVVAVVIGGVIGIDQRMRSTVKVFADANISDHQVIREEIRELGRSIPPEWFREEVRSNEQTIKRLEADMSALRISIAELVAVVRQFEKGM